jgi:hypothetical protein
MKPTFLLSTILLSAAGAAFADIQTFEGDGFGAWQTEGKAFGLSPVHEKLDGMEKPFTNFANDAFALSAHGGNDAVGTLTSPEIKIDSDYLMFLVAGGDTPAKIGSAIDHRRQCRYGGNRQKKPKFQQRCMGH